MAGDASSSKIRRKVTSSEPPPAAEVFAGNVDLLTELLLRLPAKSLIRFQCVSNHWRSLVSDPQFARSHSRRNPRPSISGLFSFLPLSGSSTLPTLSFLHDVVSGRCMILHSCNGLLLFCRSDRFIVCNPTTRKHSALPPLPPSQHGTPFYGSCCLAFDPSKSHHYKVVVLMGSRLSPEIEIYSSESGCWKGIPTLNGGYENNDFYGNGVFWKGAIHWLRDKERGLLRFEVEEERMIATPSPSRPKILPHDKIRYFGECGGRLLLIQAPDPSRLGFRILAMDEDLSRWTVNCWVDLKPLVPAFPDLVSKCARCSVLCVLEGEEEKDFVFVLAIPISGAFISYNPKRKTWNVLPQWLPGGKTGYVPPFYYRYPFVPSLSPVV